MAEKKLVVEGGWARIGAAAGALEKTWGVGGDGSPVSLGDGAVRLHYRFEGRAVTLKIRDHTTFGYVTLWPHRLDLGIWSTSYAEREKRVQTQAFAAPIKEGEEGVLELAAVGCRLVCRLNETIVLTSEELSDLSLTGGCEIQSDGVSFRDVEYLDFGRIPDPLKALGWEAPDAVGWSDFFADWERSPDRNEFEKTSLEHGTMGWQAARNESGANAYLVDSQGRDLAFRITAKFEHLRNPKDSDQITVRLRRTPRGLRNEYNEYAIYLFRSGQADLRVVDDSGSRKLITAQLPDGFDPHNFHTIEVSTKGHHISFLVDGQEMGTAEDESLPPGGRFGINGSQSVVFEKAEYRFLNDPKASPATATKDAPFTNSLGMKFVPVPITGGPTDRQRVLFSVWETRVQDYEVFAKETKRKWERPEFAQGPTHPALRLTWNDASDFCAWLIEREREAGRLAAEERYRLPSDHDWNCAVGIGDRDDASLPPKRRTGRSPVFPGAPTGRRCGAGFRRVLSGVPRPFRSGPRGPVSGVALRETVRSKRGEGRGFPSRDAPEPASQAAENGNMRANTGIALPRGAC